MKKISIALWTILTAFTFINSPIHPIIWRFDKFKKLTFQYEQTASIKSGLIVNDEVKTFNKLNGKLIVKVKSPTLADIILIDLKMSICSVDSVGDTSIIMTTPVPEMFIQDLKPDGTIEGQLNQQTEMLAKTLFPTMNKNSKIGDSTDLPMTMPFNMFGSVINVQGYNRIKYVDYKNGLDILETIINVSDFKIPDEVKTKYNCYMKGSSKFDFDSKKGYFINGKVKINMAFGEENSDSTACMMNMSMDMKSEIAFRLISAE